MKIRKNIRLLFFFSFIAVKLLVSGVIIGLLTLYILPLSYKVIGIKISYIIIGTTIFIMFKYWERFIKRKLHFILIGNKKI